MKNLSIYIPALNEEKELQNTIDNVVQAAQETLDNYELLLINDGSSDRTAEIMEKNADQNKNIRVIHHSKSMGLRSIFFECMNQVKYANVSWVAGDNPISYSAIKNLFGSVEDDTLVIGYRVNLNRNRKIWRIILSKGMMLWCSLLTGIYLKDVHGGFILPVKHYKKLGNFVGPGLGFQVEFTIRLLRQKINYKFTPLPINSGIDRSSNFNTNIAKDVLKTLVLLSLPPFSNN